MSHRLCQPIGQARLELMRKRAHVDRNGRDKIKYTPTEADGVVARMNERPGHDPVEWYACPECGWIHVGHRPTVNERRRPDMVTILESGERVEACERMENTGKASQRIAAIVQRCQAAERRRVSLPAVPAPR